MLKQLARLALLPVFVRGGWNQMNHAQRYVELGQKAGVPATEQLVKASAWAKILGALALQIPYVRKIAAFGLAAQLLVVTYVGHRFWEVDGQQRDAHLTQVGKNAGLIAALLYELGSR